MIYLLLTIAANTGMIFVMKHSEAGSGNRYGVTFFNYAAGVIISFLLMKEKTLFVFSPEGMFAMALAIFNAACMTGCLLLCQKSIRENGAPLSTTFNRLGILIPTVLSAIFFQEMPGGMQIVGLVVAVFAIVYINGQPKDSKRIGSASTLILVFAVGGLIDFNSKLFGIYGEPGLQDYFVFWTFGFALLISLGLLLWKNRRIEKKDLYAGIMVGIPNQMITYCMVKAVMFMPAYLVFPVYSAAVILAVNVINVAVFRERPSQRELVGTGIIAAALVLINLG